MSGSGKVIQEMTHQEALFLSQSEASCFLDPPQPPQMSLSSKGSGTRWPLSYILSVTSWLWALGLIS